MVVAVPPMIWVPNQLIGASVGDEVTMECSTEAFPLSLNYWMRESNPMVVVATSDKYKVSNNESSYKTHMKMTIRKVASDDFGKLIFIYQSSHSSHFYPSPHLGTYFCIAKNSFSETRGSIRLYGEFN